MTIAIEQSQRTELPDSKACYKATIIKAHRPMNQVENSEIYLHNYSQLCFYKGGKIILSINNANTVHPHA